MNELQKIFKKAEKSFEEIYRMVLKEIRAISVLTTTKDKKDITKMIKEIMSKAEYEQKIKDIIATISLESASSALGANFSIASTDKYITWRMDQSYKGLILSEVIRENAKEATRIITNTIVEKLKAGTTWKKLSKAINKIDKVGDISVKIADIAATGKKLLTDPRDIAKLNSQVQQAQKYVNNLSPGDAPTKQLKNAYQKVIDSIQTQDSSIIEKALNKAINAKIAYNNDRIARTEISRAYSQALVARVEDDPDVTGYKWILSSRHTEIDQCNYYAELDNGMGPGIYSKDDLPPLPAHPNCLCSLVLYSGKPPKNTTQKATKEYLKNLSKEKREKIIGKENAQYESKYIQGLQKKGIQITNKRPERLPENLIKQTKE